MFDWGQVPELWTEFAVRMLSLPEASGETLEESLQRIRKGRTSDPRSLESLVGVWDEAQLWSACWLHDLGNRTAAFGDPWTTWFPDPSIAHRVLERTSLALSDWCREHQPRSVQGMLSAQGADVWGELLCQHGWAREGGLDYLGRVLADDPGIQRWDSERFRQFKLVEARRYRETELETLVARTQRDSLDCRYLEGQRTVSEMLAAFRAATRTQDSLWLVLQDAGEPIGCLFFGLHDAKTVEWIYLGLIPERRGRGLGTHMASRGLQVAQRLGVRSVLVAVDSLNRPAIRLYEGLGFSLWDRRSVFLKWHPKAPDSLETAQ